MGKAAIDSDSGSEDESEWEDVDAESVDVEDFSGGDEEEEEGEWRAAREAAMEGGGGGGLRKNLSRQAHPKGASLIPSLPLLEINNLPTPQAPASHNFPSAFAPSTLLPLRFKSQIWTSLESVLGFIHFVTLHPGLDRPSVKHRTRRRGVRTCMREEDDRNEQGRDRG